MLHQRYLLVIVYKTINNQCYTSLTDLMVAKKRKELTEKEAEEIMSETRTDHSTHLRTKIYDRECYWCVAFGFINNDNKDNS